MAHEVGDLDALSQARLRIHLHMHMHLHMHTHAHAALQPRENAIRRNLHSSHLQKYLHLAIQGGDWELT